MKYLSLICISVFILTLFANNLSAQNPNRGNGAAPLGRFYGKVVDGATGKGLAYATVKLWTMRRDSSSGQMQETLITGQLSFPNGDFSLENIPTKGVYTLKVNFLGYAATEQKVQFEKSTDVDLGNIVLSAASEVLDEVKIVGEYNTLTLALDKKVYKVDKDAIAAGGTAEDALKNVPTVSVDIDGNVSMRNASPQIFIDGRPSTLTVDQIPADAIDNIELITNPSAKYDASGGGGGIINIVLKKERRIGYNGSIRAGLDSRAKYNFRGDINAREGKFNTFLSGGVFARKSLIEGESERHNFYYLPYTDIYQNSNSTNDRLFFHIRGGVDWFLDNRNTLTFAADYHGGNFNNDDTQNITSDTLYDDQNIRVLSTRYSDSKRTFKNTGTQLLYKHIFPREGRELSADVNYNGSKSTNAGLYNTVYNTFDTKQKQENEGFNDFLTFQTDYTDPLTANIKIEAGARAAVRTYNSQNATYEYFRTDGNYLRVPGFADRYEFKDQVYAAYGTYSHSFTQWGYQLGLRAESSYYSGYLPDVDSTFENQYPASLFPSAFVTYKLNDQDNLQFNYSRRINRPSFFQMIPFPDFSDSLLISKGNPGLVPEFSNNLELSYQNILNDKNNFLLSVYYRRASNLITGYIYTEYNDVLGRDALISSYINSNSSQAYGVEFTIKNTIWKAVELSSNINCYNSIVNAQNVENNLSVEQFTWFIKENMTVRLPWQMNFQASYQYQSRTAFALGGGGGGHGWGGGPSSTAQGYSIPYWVVDLSLRKDVLKRRGSISVSVQDVFRSRRTGSHSESVYFIQDSWRLRDPQLVRLNFSYKFGKFDASLFKRRNTRQESGDGMDGGF